MVKDSDRAVFGDRAENIIQLYSDLVKYRADKKAAGAKIKAIEARLYCELGDNKSLSCNKQQICHQAQWESDNLISPEQIKEACPEAYGMIEKAGLVKKHKTRRLY